MLYQSGQAFRQALEVRLRSQSLQTDVPLSRLRKLISFERFLARLALYQPGQWLLKGGLALEWRLGSIARTTKDIDVLSLQPLADAHQAIVNAVSQDLDDYFRFVVQRSTDSAGPREGLGLRLQMQAWLDGRLFESFHLDVGWGDPVVDPPQALSAPPLLQFAGIAPASVLCYPITQHVAEKVHAYVQVHQGGEGSRVKDLVDILLIAGTQSVEASALRRALDATFRSRDARILPVTLPSPPASWRVPFGRLAAEVGLGHLDLELGIRQARAFLDPVLRSETVGLWDPTQSVWIL